MANIELLIKIDEEEYKNIKACTSFMPWAEYLIKNGKPLPKGRGDLIDRKELLNTFWTYCRDGDFGYHQAEDLIKSASTIIKADKESEGE